jgi:Tfp pilus assembly protein FimV
MSVRGKHRRPKSTKLSRGFAIVGTGGAALALPAIGAASAHAAPAAQSAAAERSAAPTAAPVKKVAADKAESKTYSVSAGDTLHKIAEEHSVDGGWKALYEANRKAVGDDPSTIRPGLDLTLETDAGSQSSGSAKASTAAYGDNLEGWIKESLAIMEKEGIPGTYEGIHRNIMRESGGDPQATNDWDSNAAAGTPSQGLLQVIAPTFESYHVPGTPKDSLDPVANITAACNYAADQYGSIDNVNGPY